MILKRQYGMISLESFKTREDMNMQYQKIVRGIFLSRPNRFIAIVKIDGREHTVHVKNTGRCRELLVPGAEVLLEYHEDYLRKGRKTEYSLVAVYKGKLLINMDSQAPNQAAEEWLRGGGLERAEEWLRGGEADRAEEGALKKPEVSGAGPASINWKIKDIRREVVYGNSRFDLAFVVEETGGAQENGSCECPPVKSRPAFMEVKGVTLEQDGVVMFPDAPTERGVKHLRELAKAAERGYLAYVLFVIQMKGVKYFTPNRKTHLEFAKALKEVSDAGVKVLAFDCMVEENGFYIDQPAEVRWEGEAL